MPVHVTADVLGRFWSKVDRGGGRDACWPWVGNVLQSGYGQFALSPAKMVRAHRFSWMLANGDIPTGQAVCHNCPAGDNPRCVNPAHLWLGTPSENLLDRDAKGRQARGERHGSRTHPERLARGRRNGAFTKPDRTRHVGTANGSAKLADGDVRAIRAKRAAGETLKAIGSQFGVTFATVYSITTRRTWKHLA